MPFKSKIIILSQSSRFLLCSVLSALLEHVYIKKKEFEQDLLHWIALHCIDGQNKTSKECMLKVATAVFDRTRYGKK